MNAHALGRAVFLGLSLCVTSSLASAQAKCLGLTASQPAPWVAGDPLDLYLSGNPGDFTAVIISDTLAPTVLPFGTLDVQLNATTVINLTGVLPPSGSMTVPCPSTCGLGLSMAPLFIQAVSFSLPLNLNCTSSVLVAEFVTPTCGLPCAVAATLDTQWSTLPRYHAMILGSGLGDDYFFKGDGVFREFKDGSATLTGTLESRSDPSACWTLTVSYSGRQSLGKNNGVFPPAGAPKKLLVPGAYVENGGPIDPLEWRYYTVTAGMLVGCGKYSGATVSFVGRGAPFQVGEGASGKNLGFGASGWIDLTTLQQPTNGSLPASFVGDLNVDLTDCTGGA